MILIGSILLWITFLSLRKRFYNLDSRLERCLKDLNTGNVSVAIQEVHSLLRDHPMSVKAHETLARLYEMDHKFKEAVDRYTSLLDMIPESRHTEIIEKIARVHMKSGNLKEAAIVFGQLCTMEPASFKYKMELSSILLGMESWDSAVKELKEADNLSPNNPVLKMRLGVALLRSDQIDEAMSIFEDLVSDDSKRLTARYHLSEIYQFREEWSKALEQLETILKTASGRLKNCALMDAGNCCHELNRHLEAAQYYEEGLNLTADPVLSEEFKYNLGLSRQLASMNFDRAKKLEENTDVDA